MNGGPAFFEVNFIHQHFHQADATAVNGSDILWSCRVRHLINVESLSFVPYCDRDFRRRTAAANMDLLSSILTISVNDGVCEGFAQSNLNVGLAFRDAT